MNVIISREIRIYVIDIHYITCDMINFIITITSQILLLLLFDKLSYNSIIRSLISLINDYFPPYNSCHMTNSFDIDKSSMSNCFILIVQQLKDSSRYELEGHAKQIVLHLRIEIEPIWGRKGTTVSKQGKLSRKFMNDIIRGFCSEPPQFHCLIMAGKKIHVSLFVDRHLQETRSDRQWIGFMITSL